MSDGGRERASIEVKAWKSSQEWSVQRSAVRSIAWLDAFVVIIALAAFGEQLATHHEQSHKKDENHGDAVAEAREGAHGEAIQDSQENEATREKLEKANDQSPCRLVPRRHFRSCLASANLVALSLTSP